MDMMEVLTFEEENAACYIYTHRRICCSCSISNNQHENSMHSEVSSPYKFTNAQPASRHTFVFSVGMVKNSSIRILTRILLNICTSPGISFAILQLP